MCSGNVLVVDDDAKIQAYLHHVLESQGYSVSCLDSGNHVLDRLKRMERPSVVLLDLLMPRSDGMEVLGRIRGASDDIPVIVMSGVAQTRSVVVSARCRSSATRINGVSAAA